MIKTVITGKRAVIITATFGIVFIAITMIYQHNNSYQNVDKYVYMDPYQHGDQYHKFDRKGRISYVLAWDFCEGQSSASRNLLGLLHWATTIDFLVVEPCVHNSFFNMDHCINEPLGNDTL